jgi:hypothetical protein
MFGRKPKFKRNGIYDGHPYQSLDDGKVDVDLDGKIVRFNSVEEMIAGLDRAGASDTQDYPVTTSRPPPIPEQPPAPLPVPKKKKPDCGCFTIILIVLAIFYFAHGNSDGNKIADVINSQFGRVCEAKIEGAFSNILRLDWTSETTKLNMITVMAAIGKSKETLYSKGVRYLKFPNDGGGYNTIDWKTGEKSSINERAPYFFN